MRDTIDMARESWIDVYGLGHDRAKFIEALKHFEALVRADSQRTWVGLTDEERFKVAEQTGCMSADWLDVVKATETALQIKNQ